MKILFDQGVPVPLRKSLTGHEVAVAFELGWATLKNGELLAAMVAEGFEVFITTDQNLEYQQNLHELPIAIVILSTTAWPTIKTQTEKVLLALEGVDGVDVVRVEF